MGVESTDIYCTQATTLQPRDQAAHCGRGLTWPPRPRRRRKCLHKKACPIKAREYKHESALYPAWRQCMSHGCSTSLCTVNCVPTRFILAEILVLDGRAIPPAPVAPASTRISSMLKRVGTQFTRECGCVDCLAKKAAKPCNCPQSREAVFISHDYRKPGIVCFRRANIAEKPPPPGEATIGLRGRLARSALLRRSCVHQHVPAETSESEISTTLGFSARIYARTCASLHPKSPTGKCACARHGRSV